MAGQTSLLWFEAGTEAQSGTTGDSFLKNRLAGNLHCENLVRSKFLREIQQRPWGFQIFKRGGNGSSIHVIWGESVLSHFWVAGKASIRIFPIGTRSVDM